MANQRCSYWAARWSLEKLFGLDRERDLFHEPATNCRLWTFTTADVVDAPELHRRFRLFYRKWHRAGERELEVFRVAEKHPGGHGWHLHFCTPHRYDVRKVRKYAERAGFGRINVIEIPVSKACYVIKYLVKALRAERNGARLWACVGFKGHRATDLRITDTFWSEVFSGSSWGNLVSLQERRQRGLARVWAPFKRKPEIEGQRSMKLEKKHEPIVLEALTKGHCPMLVEYRGYRVDKIEWNDKKTGKRMEAVVTRHAVEYGEDNKTEVASVGEWNPDGMTVDAASAEAAKKYRKGAMYLLKVTRRHTEKGNTELSGELVLLS